MRKIVARLGPGASIPNLSAFSLINSGSALAANSSALLNRKLILVNLRGTVLYRGCSRKYSGSKAIARAGADTSTRTSVFPRAAGSSFYPASSKSPFNVDSHGPGVRRPVIHLHQGMYHVHNSLEGYPSVRNRSRRDTSVLRSEKVLPCVNAVVLELRATEVSNKSPAGSGQAARHIRAPGRGAPFRPRHLLLKYRQPD